MAYLCLIDRSPGGVITGDRWADMQLALAGCREMVGRWRGRRLTRPTRGHHLAPGVEGDALRPLHVLFAKQGSFPSAKGIISERDGDRYVDTHHADAHAALEFARGFPVGRKNGGTVAIR